MSGFGWLSKSLLNFINEQIQFPQQQKNKEKQIKIKIFSS